MREIRCSKLSRYMKCRGYAFMRDLPEDPPGEPAKEGTAFGELLQSMLEQRTTTPNVLPNATNGVNFDNDMRFYAGEFAKSILDLNVPVSCEKRIDWQAGSDTMIRGQFDVHYILGDVMCIDDAKYGWRLVEPFENWQLLGYAIGLLKQIANSNTIKSVRLRIFQPRPHHEKGWIREWTISVSELYDYYQKICEQVRLIETGDSTLQTGDHCRYCEAARGGCPAFNKAFYNAVDVTLSNFEQDSLSEEEISNQLKLLERVKDIIKIKWDSIEALAISRIREGGIVRGYGLDQTQGHRSWKQGVSADVIESIVGRSVVEQSLISPNKLEKMGIPKKFIDRFTSREMKAAKLKPMDTDEIGNQIFGSQQPKGQI